MAYRSWGVQAWHPLALSLMVAMGLCSLVAFNLFESRRDNWDRTSQSTRNLARAVAEEIGRTVESLDLSLRGVADNSRVPGVMALEPRLRDLTLFDRAATASNLGYLMLLDADGQVVATARPGEVDTSDFADRVYFTAHRDDRTPTLRVSAPFRSHLTRQWVVALSRRVTNADGSFGGVAVGTIRLDAVRDLFAAMDLGAHGSISLFHDDGTLVMRVPYRAAFIGSDVSGTDVFRRSKETPGGQFVAVSKLDGVRRLHSLADVGNGPLHVAVSLSVAEVEAGWWRHAWIIGSTACVLVGVLALAALALRRELRRRQEAEAAARESEANFRLLAENCGDMVSRIGPDGVRRYVSPASIRLLGVPPAELVGRRPQEEIHPNDTAGLALAAERLQHGEAEEATVAYRTRRADGSWIWVESTIRVVRDPVSGALDGLVAVSRDVTERKNVEAELARLATVDGLTGVANRRSFD
ncbi:MAG: PAS domain S-box protein, partial [Caulobacteraceae bacterium]